MNTTVEKIQSLLGQDATRPWWKRATLWGTLAVLVALAAAGLVWQGKRAADAQPRYVAEPVTRGHLVVTVAANGILAPTNKADIGSELSGTVARVLVDFNDTVKKGQVLAELDTAKLDDQVMRSRAALDVAHAKVRQSQATVQEATGNLQRLQEVARLSGGRVPSQAELATAQATLARAQADATGAQAGVADATAALSADETNRRKASIRSPINGIVLSRSVDPGNAVAASLQAVTLFTLAEDLSQMKLAVNVDEADVGQVRQRPEGDLQRQRLPQPQLPGHGHARELRVHDQGQRRHLHRRAERGQRRPVVAPGHDGRRADRGDRAQRRAAGAQCRPALHARDCRRGAGRCREQRPPSSRS